MNSENVFVTHRLRIDFHTKMVHWDCPWDVDEDTNLLKGIYEFGMGNWEQIKMEPELNLYNKVIILLLYHISH